MLCGMDIGHWVNQRLCLHPDGGQEEREGGPTQEEKALLREEFIGQMHQRFLAGQDKDFNYRSELAHLQINWC